jgi:hypothetical protein
MKVVLTLLNVLLPAFASVAIETRRFSKIFDKSFMNRFGKLDELLSVGYLAAHRTLCDASVSRKGF